MLPDPLKPPPPPILAIDCPALISGAFKLAPSFPDPIYGELEFAFIFLFSPLQLFRCTTNRSGKNVLPQFGHGSNTFSFQFLNASSLYWFIAAESLPFPATIYTRLSLTQIKLLHQSFWEATVMASVHFLVFSSAQAPISACKSSNGSQLMLCHNLSHYRQPSITYSWLLPYVATDCFGSAYKSSAFHLSFLFFIYLYSK